jgi:hypothetical protein
MKKVFYLNNDEEKPIKAGGVVLYKVENQIIQLLMIEIECIYEDLGGKVDPEDETIFDTVAREAYEESNYLLDQKKIKERLFLAKYVYVPHSKYMVFLIEANIEESLLTSRLFGNKEIKDNIERIIKWVPVKYLMKQEIIKHKLCTRLKHKDFFDIVNGIEKKIRENDIFDDMIKQTIKPVSVNYDIINTD